MMKAVPFLLFVGAAAFVSSSRLEDARATDAVKVPVITVHAKEFAFTAPATIAPGPTSFRLVNDGKELHHLTVMKLEQGKTLKDLEAAMKNPGPPPNWLVSVGGPNAAAPGGSVEATLNLEAGNYILACFIPSPGSDTPHMMKGMIKPLTVAGGVSQAGGTFVEEPKAEIHLDVKDYGFVFSKPLTAGKHVIHVMNDGPQEHEVIFVKLNPGKHIADVVKYVETDKMKGPPPSAIVDGMSGLAKGRTGTFTANLTPGTYGLFCMAPDVKDGKSHADHGMTAEFVVK